MAEAEVKVAAKAAVEKADNAFLEKLFGNESAPAAEATEAPAEEPKAKAVAAKEEPQEETTEQPEAAAEEKPAKSDKAQSDSEYEKACSVLALDGVSKTVLGKLDRAEVLEWASKAKERQAKTANELKTRSERIKELEGGVTTTKAETKAESQTPTAEGDDPELRSIRETFGDEFATPLAQYVKKQTEGVKAAYEERLAQLESERVRNLIDGARASLRDQFPQLDDPAKLEQVQAEMGAHLAKYQDKTPTERANLAMRDAARVLFFDELRASEAGKALASHKRKMSSQPTPPSGRTTGPRVMSASEREDALLDAIFRGDGEAKERIMRGS
jgi:hypothetical protein